MLPIEPPSHKFDQSCACMRGSRDVKESVAASLQDNEAESAVFEESGGSVFGETENPRVTVEVWMAGTGV